MKKLVFVLALVSIVAVALAACGGGGGSAAPGSGDAARGKDLYNKATLGKSSAAGCSSCHLENESKGKAEKAPYTAGTATRAASRVPGMSAADYIRESIVKPDAYVVEGFKAGDMYQKWSTDLSPQEIEDLIAYLLTEK